jgi:hypothetical protein
MQTAYEVIVIPSAAAIEKYGFWFDMTTNTPL